MDLSITGSVRAAGVLYIGIMDHFGATREEAAWPIALTGAMLSLIGMVVGPLAQACSPKPVILFGSLLVSVGLLASVFAPDVKWLTFTFGFVFGSGLGTVYTINVIFLQQYFVNMRGLALGLFYTGSTIAGLIFPVLLTFLLEEYGFRGAVLILSGLLLHIFVLSLTHKEAPCSGTGTESPKKITRECGRLECREQRARAQSAKATDPFIARNKVSSKIPEFLVIVFSFTLFMYAYDAYATTIIDFIVDQDIPMIEATTIVPLYSATDMVARLILPQLGDRGYVNKMLLQCFAYALQSVCFFLLPMAAATGEFFWIALVAMIQSTGIGTSLVMYGVLMAELVGLSRLPMAYGVSGLIVGSSYFTKPFFVGLFRDVFGNYSMMYNVCGVLTAVSSTSWLITWYFHRTTDRGRKLSAISNRIDEHINTDPMEIVEDFASMRRRFSTDSTAAYI
ncbi:monocarboxylate transporter 13-like [Galendromus occidentalis]|uniref:Monocarboxylate transporter 13-like n=1 Tax=Galendromus occidentalis TaxID=34638 RepID=A0AAJ7WHA6_9ACAR|nr:monocarboxylate transporter 13-like [Galendromus occidentalis]